LGKIRVTLRPVHLRANPNTGLFVREDRKEKEAGGTVEGATKKKKENERVDGRLKERDYYR